MNPKADENLNFLPRVEAARGVAAMMVAVGHSIAVLSAPSALGTAIIPLMAYLFNGSAAVSMFFVISGFVLGLSLDKTRGENFIRNTGCFLFRRILRLYPAFIACLSLVLFYLFFLHTPRTFALATPWFNGFYQTLPKLNETWGILSFRDTTIIPISWTLRSELICSSLLPFLHWISRRMNHFWNFVGAAFFIALAHCFTNQFVGNIQYFYLGLIVPTVGLHYFSALKNRHFLCGGILLVSLVIWLMRGTPSVLNLWNIAPAISCFVLVTSLASHLHYTAYRFLDLHIVRFYGQISYSFYLFHFICLFLLTRLVLWAQPWGIGTHPMLYTFLLIFLSCTLTALPGYYSWKHVELPFVALSRSLLRSWKKQPA